MGFSASIRKSARDVLSGKWGSSVGTTVIQFLCIGAAPYFFIVITNIILFSIIIASHGSDTAALATLFTVYPIEGLVFMIFNIALSTGYRWQFLDLYRGNSYGIGVMFQSLDSMRKIVRLFGAALLLFLYTLLWSLLLIVPGIIKSYSYSQTFYILKDHPECTINEAITESRQLMDGYKWLGASYTFDPRNRQSVADALYHDRTSSLL
ncbi:DUF975 family protein [Sporolactobacillus shoreicorticis]|uniref:DUF975 family protein n=1 Tax=Sporolactobacillus shoreicorticis TaxID=1923877 RepID=A0ABW5S420_9BACL|nr:DUF975 family protein [Sporolactobacillus shoreicorticis]MCO7127662.1 DUF975 family protein [Sporolactobacillus shoreicorticis]